MLPFALWALASLHSLRPVSGETSVHFKKFNVFFELLDQSGALSKEFSDNNGDVCAMKGVVCEGGEPVEMCASSPVPRSSCSLALNEAVPPSAERGRLPLFITDYFG
jgi:hypothetical protein